MKLSGINQEFKSGVMAAAFKKSGYKLLEKKVSWPRRKGPAVVQVDCSRTSCKNVLALVNS